MSSDNVDNSEMIDNGNSRECIVLNSESTSSCTSETTDNEDISSEIEEKNHLEEVTVSMSNLDFETADSKQKTNLLFSLWLMKNDQLIALLNELTSMENEISGAEKRVALMKRRRAQIRRKLQQLDPDKFTKTANGSTKAEQKEEEKRQRALRKEEEKRLKDIERQVIREQREMARLEKLEAKKKREEAKLEERKKREEEKEEKRRKEEDRKREEQKDVRRSDVKRESLLKFLVATPRESDEIEDVCGFRYLHLKNDRVRIAPINRCSQMQLTNIILRATHATHNFLDEFKEAAKQSEDTFPEVNELPDDEDVMYLGGDEDTFMSAVSLRPQIRRVRFIALDSGVPDAVRPAYLGTWTRMSNVISGRCPLRRDNMCVDYENDSEDEWLRIDDEDGDECSSDDGSDEDSVKVDVSDGDDNDFLVPDDYISDASDDDLDDDGGGDGMCEMKERMTATQRWLVARRKQEKKRMNPVSLGVFLIGGSGYERVKNRFARYEIFHPEYIVTESKVAKDGNENVSRKSVNKKRSQKSSLPLSSPPKLPTIKKPASPIKKKRKVSFFPVCDDNK
ncbi:hypothetical protein ACOME3_004175 [Neoechinorhynchus agilis]